MGAAIGQVLPFAVGVALSPIPIIAAIMAVLCLVIGAKLIGDAISGFSM
jgi:hypothetical protein